MDEVLSRQAGRRLHQYEQAYAALGFISRPERTKEILGMIRTLNDKRRFTQMRTT